MAIIWGELWGKVKSALGMDEKKQPTEGSSWSRPDDKPKPPSKPPGR